MVNEMVWLLKINNAPPTEHFKINSSCLCYVFNGLLLVLFWAISA
jgi:hypothetical protein